MNVSLLAGFRELLTPPPVSWSTAISFWFLVYGVGVLNNALDLDTSSTRTRGGFVLMSLAARFPWPVAGPAEAGHYVQQRRPR